jgi:choline kinase
MQIPRVAVVAAAGMGTRLGLNIPKPLVKILDRSILSHQLEILSVFEEVRFVVGFKEHEIMAEVLKIRPDSIFVRNPNFFTTGSADSFSLATKELRHPALLIDGDTLVRPESFRAFLASYTSGGDLIGVTRTKTSNPVGVRLSLDSKTIYGFTSEEKMEFEWCGLAILNDPSAISMSSHGGYLYKHLESLLPLVFHIVEAEEVDTEADLERTRVVLKEW